jgi:hypothetical protein
MLFKTTKKQAPIFVKKSGLGVVASAKLFKYSSLRAKSKMRENLLARATCLLCRVIALHAAVTFSERIVH